MGWDGDGSEAYDEYSLPGSPLDVGNFFCDALQPGSREASISLDLSDEGASQQGAGERSARAGGAGAGAGGLGAAGPRDAHGERRLPQLKEEEGEGADAAAAALDKDEGWTGADAAHRGAPTGDVVHVPAGPSDHGDHMRSVRARVPRAHGVP